MRSSTVSTSFADKQRDREQPDRRAHGRQDQPPGVRAPRDRPGLSLSSLSFIAAACGGDDDDEAATGTTEGTAKPGGALRTGIIAPAIELNPLVVYDEGGLAVLGQSGEYLAWSNDQLELEPRLAELDAERRRLDLDVQDPPGRHVPRRHAHRQGRRLHPQPQRGPEERRERALRVRRPGRPLGGRRGGSTTPRSSSRSTARTAASPTSSARTTTTSSSFPTASTRRRGRSRSWEPVPGFSTGSRRSRA